MATKISFISGKGGSGKTTISLSLAKMLSDCNIKVLLIDCDTATNGATYFFESKIVDKDNILSLPNLFLGNAENMPPLRSIGGNTVRPIVPCIPASPITVSDFFHFIPASVSSQKELTVPQIKKGSAAFLNNLASLEKEYDIILFDCQAGFSDLVKMLVTQADYCVFVLEVDAISSASIRVLYSRLANVLTKKRCYQIFNKITEQEKSVYEQITSGTLFDSLPPISFNWEVRKAFAFSMIPDMVSTNTKFGLDVFHLAVSMLPAFRDALQTYTREILLHERDELEIQIEKLYKQEVLFDSTTKKKRRIFYILSSLPPIISIISFVYLLFSLTDASTPENLSPGQYSVTITAVPLLLILSFMLYQQIKNSGQSKEISEANLTRIKCRDEILKHEKRLSEIGIELKGLPR